MFTVRWHDALTAACGTALITAVHRQAPGVQLRLPAEPGTDTPELRRGEVDLESSSSAPTLRDIRHRLVGKDRLVVAARPGHPLTAGPLSPERYAAAEHLTVSRRGSLHDSIDDALTTHGLERRVLAAGPPPPSHCNSPSTPTSSSPSPTRSPARPGNSSAWPHCRRPSRCPTYLCTCCGTSATTTTAPTPGCETWPPKPSRHCSHHRPPLNSPSSTAPGSDGYARRKACG